MRSVRRALLLLAFILPPAPSCGPGGSEGAWFFVYSGGNGLAPTDPCPSIQKGCPAPGDAVHGEAKAGSDEAPVAQFRCSAHDVTRYGPNKADLPALTELFNNLSSLVCSQCLTVVTGGVNQGAALSPMLKACPSITIHGFDVQRSVFSRKGMLRRTVQPYPNAHLHRIGMGAKSGTHYNVSRPGNAHEGTGLFEPPEDKNRILGGRALVRHVGSVSTVRLDDFARGVVRPGRVFYTLLDAEGFEPLVLQGMGLDTVSGQRMFGAIQWEAGIAWTDARRPAGTFDRFEQLQALERFGYESYLIGSTSEGEAEYLPIKPGCFDAQHSADWNRGANPNVLSLHTRFANAHLKRFIHERSVTKKSRTRAPHGCV